MDWDWGSENPFTLMDVVLVITLVVGGPAVAGSSRLLSPL